MDSLYNENHIWGRLFRKFMDLFPQATKPTKKLLALFLIGQLCTEHFTSVRNLHKTFLSSVCDKKLNSYYYALSNDKIANTQIRQILAKMSLSIILFCEPYNDKEIFLAVWLIVPKLPKIPISSWSSWQLWVGIRVMQRKNCKVLSI